MSRTRILRNSYTRRRRQRRRRFHSVERFEDRILLSAFVNIPTNLVGEPGSVVTARIQIDDAESLESADIRLSYDSSVLSVQTIRLGDLPYDTPIFAFDAETPGEITIGLGDAVALGSASGSLADIDFLVAQTAVPGSWTVIDLESVSLNEGALTISPQPVDGDDPTDGLLTIVSLAAAQINIRLVHEATQTDADGEIDVLPDNAEWIDEWAPFWIEVWLNTPSRDDVGVLSASVDLTYNTDYFTATTIEYGPAFTENMTGTIVDAAGVIDDLGAATLQTDVGDDRYALLARVLYDATADDLGVPLGADEKYITSVDAEFGFDDAHVTLVGDMLADVELGDSPDTELWPVMYDIDDSNRIDFGDFALFASAFRGIAQDGASSATWASDFNFDGVVNFSDFALFAANFRAGRGSGTPLIYDGDYPGADNTLRITTSTSPGGDATALTEEQLAPLANEAMDRLQDALGGSTAAELRGLDVQIVNLAGGLLGQSQGNRIFIDADAAGFGWFIDVSPSTDVEFESHGISKELLAGVSAAIGRVDLLTVVMHEMVHWLGMEHSDVAGNLMEETLPTGVRRFPSPSAQQLADGAEDNEFSNEDLDGFFGSLFDELDSVGASAGWHVIQTASLQRL